MNLCDDGHDEVCYEGKGCPCCFEIKERDNQLRKAEDERDEARDALQELRTDIRAIAREVHEANKGTIE